MYVRQSASDKSACTTTQQISRGEKPRSSCLHVNH